MTSRVQLRTIIDAVNPGLPIERTFTKHTDPRKSIERFNDQLNEELAELSQYSVCSSINDEYRTKWMTINPFRISYVDPYSKWLYFSCRIEAMKKAGISSDLILYSLSKNYLLIGAGAFGTVSKSTKDNTRMETTDEIVIKSTSNNKTPIDLIHEAFIASYINQFLPYGIFNFLEVYGFTASCASPYVTNFLKRRSPVSIVETGCESQDGEKMNLLTQNVPDSKTLHRFILDHISGTDRIAPNDIEAISILMNIFVQIFAALSMAQKSMKFVHHDLHSANVLISKRTNPLTTKYQIGDRIFTVTSKYRPVIIDYGMSRISIGCKTYSERTLQYLSISRTDILEDKFIPWYDVHRILSSCVSIGMSDDVRRAASSSFFYGMICYLHTLGFNETVDQGTQAGYGILPTTTSRLPNINPDASLLNEKIGIARRSVTKMATSNNTLYETSMLDYDVNTPECMLRMMMTRSEIYQYIQDSCKFGPKRTVFMMLDKIPHNFGVPDSMDVDDDNRQRIVPRSLIDLRVWINGKIMKDPRMNRSSNGSLSKYKDLIDVSANAITKDLRDSLQTDRIRFDFLTALTNGVTRDNISVFMKAIDDSYVFYVHTLRSVNWKNQIIDYMLKIDPTFFNKISSRSGRDQVIESIERFMNLLRERVQVLNNSYPNLLKSFAVTLGVINEQDAIETNAATFMNPTDLDNLRRFRSRLSSNLTSYRTNERNGDTNGMSRDGDQMVTLLRNNMKVTKYYISLYGNMYAETLKNVGIESSQPVINITEFINSLIAFKTI